MIGHRSMTILQFHNITKMHRLYRLWLPVRAFQEQLHHLLRTGMRVVGIDQAVAFMERRLDTGKRRPVSLTFDHGYADFYAHVFPLIAEHGIPATVLMSPEKIGAVTRVEGTRIDYLSKPQLREMADRGVVFGAYEDTAWNINKIDPATVRRHIREHKKRLADIVGRSVDYFGVKEGVPSNPVRELLMSTGYKAFLTQCPTHRRPDPYAVGRIQVDDDDFNIFLTKISRTYLFFKDRRSWRHIREYKLDRVAHHLSETFDRLRGKRHGA